MVASPALLSNAHFFKQECTALYTLLSNAHSFKQEYSSLYIQELWQKPLGATDLSLMNNWKDHHNNRIAEISMDAKLKAFQTLVACTKMLVALETMSSDLNQLLLQWTQTATCLVQVLANKKRKKARRIWAVDRPQALADGLLLSSYSDKMFKARVRVTKETFHFLCINLAPHMGRTDTNMRKAIPIETRIACALSRLTTGQFYSIVGDLYGVGVSTCHRILVDFCDAVRAVFHDECVNWPDDHQKSKLAHEFQAIRGIPDIVGAIDGSHIPVLAPSNHREEFLNRKGYYSILLQCIVSARCLIWDYDFGWGGSLDNWNLFNVSNAGKRCASGDLGKYALVGDTTYAPRVWMLVPYKDTRGTLSKIKFHWNFEQFNTRMPVTKAFGMLKTRFRILTKRMDMNLGNICKIVSTCLVLHNLCILHQDHFDENWFTEAEEELESLENMCGSSSMRDMNSARAAKDILQLFQSLKLHKKGAAINNSDSHGVPDSMEGTGILVERGEQRRESLAKVLYSSKKKRPFQDLMGDRSTTEASCSE